MYICHGYSKRVPSAVPACTVQNVNYYIIISLKSEITEQEKFSKGLNMSVLIEISQMGFLELSISQLGVNVRKLSLCF